MNISIRRRLLLILFFGTLLVWSITALSSYFDTRRVVNELFDAQLAQAALALLDLSHHELYEQLAFESQQPATSHDVPHHDTGPEHKYQQLVAFQIWTGDGKLAIRSENAPEHRLIEKDNIFGDTFIDGVLWRVYSVSNEIGSIRVQVGEQYQSRNRTSSDITSRLGASIFVALPMLAMMIWLGVGSAMTPLRRLAKEVSQRKADNLSPIELKRAPIEAKPLTEAINMLFKRLQTAFDNIKLFTADAAHELRTPLAAVKTHAQIAIKSNDDNVRKQALVDLITCVDRSTYLVEQLLTIARLEPEPSVRDNERAVLERVFDAALADLVLKALEKKIDIGLNNEYQGTVLGRAFLLQIMIANLINNAIRYTPTGGSIDINVAEQVDKIIITIDDSGPGIPEEERNKVFQRFYRQASHSNITGTGLGLSIVQRIADICRVELSLSDSPLGGLRIQLGLHKA